MQKKKQRMSSHYWLCLMTYIKIPKVDKYIAEHNFTTKKVMQQQQQQEKKMSDIQYNSSAH